MVSAKMLQKYSLFGGLLEEQLDLIIPRRSSPIINRGRLSGPLSRRPAEYAPAQDVNVEMIHGLSAVEPDIDDKAGAIFATAVGASGHGLVCQFPRLVEHAAQKGSVFRFRHQQALDVFFGNNQEMNRRHGVDVMEGNHFIILVDFVAGDFLRDDFTENTITHGPIIAFSIA